MINAWPKKKDDKWWGNKKWESENEIGKRILKDKASVTKGSYSTLFKFTVHACIMYQSSKWINVPPKFTKIGTLEFYFIILFFSPLCVIYFVLFKINYYVVKCNNNNITLISPLLLL
jgi:hypothetical protein